MFVRQLEKESKNNVKGSEAKVKGNDRKGEDKLFPAWTYILYHNWSGYYLTSYTTCYSVYLKKTTSLICLHQILEYNGN